MTIGLATAIGIIVWNLTLNLTMATALNIESPALGLSVQDLGSGVLAFVVTALTLPVEVTLRQTRRLMISSERRVGASIYRIQLAGAAQFPEHTAGTRGCSVAADGTIRMLSSACLTPGDAGSQWRNNRRTDELGQHSTVLNRPIDGCIDSTDARDILAKPKRFGFDSRCTKPSCVASRSLDPLDL